MSLETPTAAGTAPIIRPGHDGIQVERVATIISPSGTRANYRGSIHRVTHRGRVDYDCTVWTGQSSTSNSFPTAEQADEAARTWIAEWERGSR